MFLSEAIQKDFTIIVKDSRQAQSLKQKHKHPKFISAKAGKEKMNEAKGIMIDEEVDVNKMTLPLEELERITFDQVFYGSVEVNEYDEVMKSIDKFLHGQEETIVAAIELRMFVSHVRKFLQDLQDAGTSVYLEPMINTLGKISKKFDQLAMEYGPYKKERYIGAVLQPFFETEGVVQDESVSD